MVSAHAGWLKKALVVGGIAYAGHAVAKKVKESKKAKESDKENQPGQYQNTQKEDKEIAR